MRSFVCAFCLSLFLLSFQLIQPHDETDLNLIGWQSSDWALHSSGYSQSNTLPQRRNPVVQQTSNCPNAPRSIMIVGILGRVTFTDGSPTRLRSEPSTNSSVVVEMPEGTTFEVIGGPECGGDYTWWQLKLDDGTIGWAAEGNSKKYFIESLPNAAQPQNTGVESNEEILGSWKFYSAPAGTTKTFDQIEFLNDGTVTTTNANLAGTYIILDGGDVAIDLIDATSGNTMQFSAEFKGEKLEITDYNGMRPYPTSEFVRGVGTANAKTDIQVQIITSDGLFLYTAPDVDSGQLVGLMPESIHHVIGKNTARGNAIPTWLQIQFDNRTAWICSEGALLLQGDINAVPITDITSYGCKENREILAVDGIKTGAVPQVAKVYYINGMNTDYAAHLQRRDDLEKIFNLPVMGIFNATGGIVRDIAQSIDDITFGSLGLRLSTDNLAVKTLVAEIKNHFRNLDQPLIIVGHSQGTAILSASLNILANEGFNHLSDLTIYTFANVAVSYPNGPTYLHCVHIEDFAASLPNFGEFYKNSLTMPHTKVTLIHGPRSVPDTATIASGSVPNHDLDGYLADFSSEDCPRLP